LWLRQVFRNNFPFLFFVVVVFVGGVFDFVSTVLALSLGFVESNPISQVVFPSLATYGFVLVGLVYWSLSKLWGVVDGRFRYVVFGVLFCICVMAWYPCCHNLLLIVFC
jgi:hypothetical protein